VRLGAAKAPLGALFSRGVRGLFSGCHLVSD